MATTRPPMEPQIVAADIGNGTTTAISGDMTIMFPSVIASFGVEPWAGGAVGNLHHLSDGDRHVIVGCEALGVPGADTLLASAYGAADGWRRYTSEATRDVLLAAVCGLFPRAAVVAVRLVVGMPVSLLDHAPAVAAHLRGTYDRAYNGQRRRVIVADVRVVGEGVELPRLLPDDQRPGTVIHDIGARTWLLASSRPGVRPRAYDLGADRLMDAAGVANDPAIRWHLTNELRASRKAQRELRAALEAQVGAALDVMEVKQPIGAQPRHAVAGGFAPIVAPVLRRRYPDAEIVVVGGDAPEQANARAYAAVASEVWG